MKCQWNKSVYKNWLQWHPFTTLLTLGEIVFNTDSYYPSYEEETKLLNEVYKEADIDPTKVSYVEISGSCNVDADAQEVNSVADVCCKDRKTPLRIGSVKTNVGNTETVSGDII